MKETIAQYVSGYRISEQVVIPEIISSAVTTISHGIECNRVFLYSISIATQKVNFYTFDSCNNYTNFYSINKSKQLNTSRINRCLIAINTHQRFGSKMRLHEKKIADFIVHIITTLVQN